MRIPLTESDSPEKKSPAVFCVTEEKKGKDTKGTECPQKSPTLLTGAPLYILTTPSSFLPLRRHCGGGVKEGGWL
jgi:hypothetical protein